MAAFEGSGPGTLPSCVIGFSEGVGEYTFQAEYTFLEQHSCWLSICLAWIKVQLWIEMQSLLAFSKNLFKVLIFRFKGGFSFLSKLKTGERLASLNIPLLDTATIELCDDCSFNCVVHFFNLCLPHISTHVMEKCGRLYLFTTYVTEAGQVKSLTQIISGNKNSTVVWPPASLDFCIL